MPTAAPEVSGAVPVGELVPQPHGGALRKGGGKLPDKRKTAAMEGMMDGLASAARAAVHAAANGEAWAVKLVIEYGLGKPVEKVEMSGPDGGPIEHAEAQLPDHEKRALHDAIQRELASREPAIGDPAPDQG